MVILDTNVIIDHLRIDSSRASVLDRIIDQYSQEMLAISIVSIQELYEGTSTRKKAQEESLIATITPLKIIPYTFEIAQFAGKLARDFSRPLELADAAIAATAIQFNAQLATLNTRDFTDLPNIDLMNLTQT